MLDVFGKLTIVAQDQWPANLVTDYRIDNFYVRSERGGVFQFSYLPTSNHLTINELKHYVYEGEKARAEIGFNFEPMIRIKLPHRLTATELEGRLSEITAIIDILAKPTELTFQNGSCESFERLCQALSDCLKTTIDFYTALPGGLPRANLMGTMPRGAEKLLNAIVRWYHPEQSRPTCLGGDLSARIPVRRAFFPQLLSAHDRAAAANLFMTFLVTSGSEPVSEKRRKNLISGICGADSK